MSDLAEPEKQSWTPALVVVAVVAIIVLGAVVFQILRFLALASIG